MNFDRLERLIKEQGKKKAFLCELAGKRRGYISDAKAGNGSISKEILAIFARELGTTVEYLTGESDEVSAKEKPADPKIDGLTEEAIKIARLFDSASKELKDTVSGVLEAGAAKRKAIKVKVTCPIDGTEQVIEQRVCIGICILHLGWRIAGYRTYDELGVDYFRVRRVYICNKLRIFWNF